MQTLYRNIRNGKEVRVRLLSVRQSVDGTLQSMTSLTTKLFNEAAVIIWACGYCANLVPINDPAGLPISIRTSHGQVLHVSLI